MNIINFKIGSQTVSLHEIYGIDPSTQINDFNIPKKGEYISFKGYSSTPKKYLNSIYEVEWVHIQNKFIENDMAYPKQGEMEQVYTIKLTKIMVSFSNL